ncbi:MAG: SAM-dependent methyltransferase [Spirochaetota bacterium]
MGYDGSLFFLRENLLPEFRDELRQKSIQAEEIAPGIFFSPRSDRLYWVLDYWPVRRLKFVSVSDGAKQLRRSGKRWAYAGAQAFRRGQLIADELRVKPLKQLSFPLETDEGEYSAFTLASADEILWTDKPLKGRFAGGKLRFHEDRTGPPSRAYLKLQEALTLSGIRLAATDTVLDLGATPGGWSFVAAQAGAQVEMIDRSRPDERLFSRFARLNFRRGDGLNPPQELLSSATVLLSDMACEPAKLFEALQAWLLLPNIRAMVCTLKFHGLSDKNLLERFAGIAGAQIYHLWYNGHEVTWVWKRPAIPALSGTD